MPSPAQIRKPQKITVQINETVMAKLTEHIQDLGLRRDQYLSRVIRQEIEQIKDYPANSEEVYAYLSKQASVPQNRKRYALSLEPDVAKSLTEICETKRLVRDSFLNRFFFYLSYGYYDDTGKKVVPSPLEVAMGFLYDPSFDARNPKLKQAGYDLYLGSLEKTKFEPCFMDGSEYLTATAELDISVDDL